MKLNAVTGLQVVMWSVCAFHVLMGLGLNLSGDFVQVAANFYGAELPESSPQFLYILRPLGVFMLALGVLAGVAAWDPLNHRSTIYVFAGIFIFRALQRIMFSQEISELFGIDGSRNISNMVFFFALAATLVVADQLARKFAPAKPAAA